jgi:molecular chaperone HtpG
MSADTHHKETLGFQTEVRQLLDLMIHSLYSNKEIFLRELISNAADAADKLRFEALSDEALFEDDPDLKVWVDVDKEARTITVRDNGIGMSRQEAVDNLGTIAKSGTQEFLRSLTGDQSSDAKLIGQFGVGFYSSFIVADRVSVSTRRAGLGAEHGVRWESSGEGEYSVETIDRAQRGTEIVLHLREDQDDLLEPYQLRSIIRKYSDHIPLPIVMAAEAPPETGEAEEGEEKQEAPEAPKEEVVNRASALWARPKNEVSEDDYKEFYKYVGHDFEDPLAWTHAHVEGKYEYSLLLYLPAHAPFDLWDREHRHGLKLYVRRVFIMDDAEHLLPTYLRFIRGVVDSDDLPLNISREILQSSRVVDALRSGTVNKALGMLEDMAANDKDKYAQAWKEFGQVLKEGPIEDFSNRERIAKLLRFATSSSGSAEQNVSLEDYVGRMKEEQKKIYYVTADSHAAAANSPHLEVFRKKGIEVLLLSDRVDEWLMGHLTELDGKPLQSVAQGALDLDELADEEEKKSQEQVAEQYKGLVERIKEALGEQVQEVRVSHRLTDSPACIVSDQMGLSPHLARMLKAAGQQVPDTKPILEVNPDHPLVVRLEGQESEARFGDWAHLLLDQAQLAEGSQLEDPAGFVRRLNGLLMELQGGGAAEATAPETQPEQSA